MQMDAGLDTGPIVSAIEAPIHPSDTAGALTERLGAMGATAIVRSLRTLASGGALAATAQPSEGATYAAKIDASHAVIDWSLPAVVLERQVRAFDPVPGARFALAGDAVKVWSAEAVPGAGVPGTVLGVSRVAIDVACGEFCLRLLTLQPAGGRRMAGSAFAAGRRLVAGTRLG
jgi:methionyl-tRNA formyltransferase